MSQRPNGALLWEGASSGNGAPIFAVITGMVRGSSNEKTGPMAQIWILHQQVAPIDYRASGADAAICGSCPQRHHLGGGCYVSPARSGPQAVWFTYRQGDYPPIKPEQLDGLRVRFGAYGDPAFAPLDLWLALLPRLRLWTAYTHQWPANRLALDVADWGWCMASADSDEERATARGLGWRTFRAKIPGTSVLQNEVQCPAVPEAPRTYGRVTCFTCGLCDGRGQAADRLGKVADVVLNTHGTFKNFHFGSQPLLPFSQPLPVGRGRGQEKLRA